MRRDRKAAIVTSAARVPSGTRIGVDLPAPSEPGPSAGGHLIRHTPAGGSTEEETP